MSMADVPPVVRSGRIRGFIVAAGADGPDAGEIPDQDTVDGMVTLTPSVKRLQLPTAEPPRTMIVKTLRCPLIGGWLYPPGTTPDNLPSEPGVVVVATQQPEALPDLVQWSASFELETGDALTAVDFEVPSGGVIDLTNVIPMTPTPGVIVVYSAEDRILAQDAAAAAAGSATDADRSRSEAASSATAAANSAGSAFDDAAIAQGARLSAEAARDAALIAAAGVALRGRIQYDAATGRYTNESLEGFFASRATPDSYGISIPKSLSTACMKTGTNAGIGNPTPSTIAQPGSDPYTAHTPFFTLEVNGGVEEDGTPFVTAVQGDARFKRDGSNGDVWIMTPVLYWQMEDQTEAVELQVSDSPLAGFTVQPKGLLPSGSKRPFMLYAKYALSIVDGVARSISGQPVAIRNISHNSLITQCKNATTGYSGKSFADDWYMKAMFLLKYATKNSQSVYAGVTSMSTQYLATVAESNTNQIIVSTSTANLIPVGSTISLGTNNPVSTDRAATSTFDVFDMRRVVDKLVVDASNTAVVVEGAAFTVEVGYRLSTMPWATGGCDRVVGDGSPTSPTNGREPFVLQGIELGLGMYESLGDVILSNLGSGQEVCLLPDSRLAATSVTANYRRTGKYLPNQAAIGWTYPTYPTSAEGLLFGADVGASTSTGMCDGQYLDAVTTQGTRQWLSLGSLNNGSYAVVWIVNASTPLSSTYWYVGSRLSAIGRGGETP